MWEFEISQEPGGPGMHGLDLYEPGDAKNNTGIVVLFRPIGNLLGPISLSIWGSALGPYFSLFLLCHYWCLLQ